MNTTGVRAHFSASHAGPDGRLHGHSYEITAYWPSDPPRDQVRLQTDLKRLLASSVDHLILGPEVSTMESLCAVLAEALEVLEPGILEIHLARPVEGLYATWRAQPAPQNRYTHLFKAVCPNNGAEIDYELTLTSYETIMVEEIAAACTYEGPTFHEDCADRLFRLFGGYQILRAHHHGTLIETIRGERPW